MEPILLSPISFEQLQKFLSDLLDEKLQQLTTKPQQTVFDGKYLTRKEVAQKLKISLPTLGVLTREGTLVSYRIGTKVLYKAEEIEASLQKIGSVHNKNSRI